MTDDDQPIKRDPKRKRPADANQRAKMIVDLATGDQSEPDPDEAKQGQAGGEAGGKARAEKLTAEQRSEIARKAARARWGGD